MRRNLIAAATLLYALGAGAANPAFADSPAVTLDAETRAAVSAAAEGTMQKLVVHEEPWQALEGAFYLPDDNTGMLADYAGQIVVVNFWATWCPPCRHEMPGLADLAQAYGDDDRIEVITIGHMRDRSDRQVAFLDEVGAGVLPPFQDRDGDIGRSAGIFGLPVTVILGPDGRELARLTGDAVWNDGAAEAVLDVMLEALVPADAEG